MAVTMNTDELLGVAQMLADAAAVETLKLFRSDGLSAENKSEDGFDPVTLADRAAERVMRDLLNSKRPNDGILGEEFGVKDGSSGLSWVLDPIDGTRAYLCGAATWGTLISVEREGPPILGVVDQPYMQERFVGSEKEAVLIRGGSKQRIKTRECASLASAVLLSTFPEIGSDAEREAFSNVAQNARLVRYGLDCYGYALVAMGHSDLVIEAGLNRYDISAPIALVQASGGIVTDWQGNPVSNGGQVIAAGDKRVHEQALELLNA